jgi:DNA-binding NarL/FixJ family response regulator
LLADLDVPAAVVASLAEELTLLSDLGRLVLEGAAVAGDPFEPELAAAAAAASEATGMQAVDELLGRDLICTTDVPRRFRFCHPLVRHAVYEATAGGWRLGAHERCAKALAARGASAAARAHHVERSARQGDLAAVAVLREAGEATARLAPESAARWFGGALRLLPQTAPAEDRVELLLARSRALAAAGRFTDSHQAALGATALAPAQPSALHTTVATACASVERFLGRYEHAHARLVRALRLLPEPASVERVELLIELTRDLDEGFVTAWAAARLAGVLFETGEPGQAVELLLGRAGGEELTLIPGGWRACCLELLTRCWLALDRPGKARRAAALAEMMAAAVQLPLAATWAGRAVAAVALDAGEAAHAAERALASAHAADAAGAPIEAALSRTIAGRALAETSEKDRAVAELQRAAAALDACGARRYRQSAERELGRLGHRPHRRTRPGKANGTGIESLTGRELQVARLVVDRKTNPQIAAELFLTHLRNIFHKMGVTTRAALARAVERTDPAASPRPR